MLPVMSAFSFLTGPTAADSWPAAPVLPGMSAVPVGHAIDLAFFFPNEGRERHDALMVETRRHLAVCVASIEHALRFALERPDLASLLAQHPEPICWPTLCAQPTLLGPALLSHMQMRAGVTLLLRQLGQPDDRLDEAEADTFLPMDDLAATDALAALAVAEARWIAPGGEEAAMQPDLPAEHFAELMWTATACLMAVVQRSALSDPGEMLPAFEKAGWTLLSEHDETRGPIAAADRVVRRMGERADMPELLGAALAQRRFLLFSALASRRLRMDSAHVADILVMGPMAELAALCRSLGGSDADYRHLLLALRPVRPSLTDAAVLLEAERYQSLTETQADALVNGLRAPRALRAKIDHLRRITI